MAVLASFGLAGCGGGSNNGSGSASHVVPGRLVQAQLQKARDAMTRGDLDTVMSVFSDNFHDEAGNGKAVVRQNLATIAGVDMLSATLTQDQYLQNDAGSQVEHQWAAHFDFRVRATGQEQTVDAEGSTIWQPEAGVWRITSTRNNGYLDVLPTTSGG
jgi:hypothetical protein